MLMQLGDFQFSVSTAAYSELSRESGSRWASIPLLGGGEALKQHSSPAKYLSQQSHHRP